jgi:ABC-2 type transport system ATP-binding protein
MPVLDVKHLSKTFKNFRAVDDVSLHLNEGEILGLLGPNGAGKTTTIQMLLGILTPTSGTIEYFGKSLTDHREEILEKINFSSTYTNLPWDLTINESLTFISYLYDIKDRKGKIKKVSEIFELGDLLPKRMRELSSGQITRVNLAKAFLNSPKVLLLDEPTASLDPETADLIRKVLVKEQEESGISIILTSHNMGEVEEVCDRVVFINEGKVVANDTPENLIKTIKIAHVFLRFGNTSKAAKFFEGQKLNFRKENQCLIVDIEEGEIPRILMQLSDQNIHYTEIVIERPTLEDFFLQNLKTGELK